VKLYVRQSYLEILTTVPSVVHTQVASLRLTKRFGCHLLVDVNFLHEQEAFILRKRRASTTEPNEREYLVVPQHRPNLIFLLRSWLRRPAYQEALDHVLLKVNIELFVGYLLSEFNDHFSPDELKYLVNPMRPFGSFHPLQRNHF
jgi:hypothetical protein